jgi:hypothetical protein
VLNVGRNGQPGVRLARDSIRIRFSRNVSDIYNQVIAQNDSLLLTRDQVDSLRSSAPSYRARILALWTSLADYLDELGDKYDKEEALRRTEAATAEAWQGGTKRRPLKGFSPQCNGRCSTESPDSSSRAPTSSSSETSVFSCAAASV